MASNETYISDQELTDLYNGLEKGSLVRILIEKHRQLERQVKKLIIPVVGVPKGTFNCPECKEPTQITDVNKISARCFNCGNTWAI